MIKIIYEDIKDFLILTIIVSIGVTFVFGPFLWGVSTDTVWPILIYVSYVLVLYLARVRDRARFD